MDTWKDTSLEDCGLQTEVHDIMEVEVVVQNLWKKCW